MTEKIAGKKDAGKKPRILKEDCETIGDNITALVREYTNYSGTVGEYVLESALRQVKENNKKVKELIDKLADEEA